jgi:hypothetical protein
MATARAPAAAVRVCWRFARVTFPSLVAAGAGGLDAEKISIAGAVSIKIIHWTRAVVLAELGPYQQKG